MTSSIVTPKTFLAYSLGCRTNQAEIEEISSQLMAYGFQPFNTSTLSLFNSPALIFLNTCVVTQKAEKETRQKIRELRKKFPKSFLVVIGCAVNARKKMNISLPEADLLISNEQKSRTIEFIRTKLLFELCREQSTEHFSTSLRFARRIAKLNKYVLSGRKLIKIQEGCNNFCSFCLTAHLRGKPKSVSPQKIIDEINFWTEKGIKEVILTGINIGLYNYCHSDQPSDSEGRGGIPFSATRKGSLDKLGMTITNLVNTILKETKIERLTFSSIYPEMLTEEFFSIVVNNPRITQCFHLSLQSGSQTILKKMNRNTDLKKLLNKLQQIKKQNPFFTFRADIIIGFPEETEKEFQETLNFIKKAKISFIHSFLFSVRPDTDAERMIKSGEWKEVPIAVKKKRAEILKNEVEKISHNLAIEQLNNNTSCLIVRKIADGYEGLTENGWPILVQSSKLKVKSLKGKILPVKITEFKNDYFFGEILSFPT